MSKTKDDHDLRCTECLRHHAFICDGRKPQQEIAPPSNGRPAVVVPAHLCKARLCAEHACDGDDGKHLCSVCVFA